jgi:hypothetical protein
MRRVIEQMYRHIQELDTYRNLTYTRSEKGEHVSKKIYSPKKTRLPESTKFLNRNDSTMQRAAGSTPFMISR